MSNQFRFILMLCTLVGQQALAQPTSNILTRISMIESATSRGTVFSIDVDGREYWITAKHVITGAKHPPYGSITKTSERLKLLQGQQWLSIEFKIIDPGTDIDIAVLAPPQPILNSPLSSLKATSDGVTLGGNCQFLGYPYGEGWPIQYQTGGSYWAPYIKHCGISAMGMTPQLLWILDGINNAGFSGGPVIYLTGLQQQVFAVVSGYRAEPTDVISSPVQTPPKPPVPQRKSSQAATKKVETKQVVNVNSGFIFAYDIKHAIDAIQKNPLGPLRPPAQ